MPTQNIHVLTGVVSLEELCEVVAKLQKQVRYLQNKGIDSENCREIGGWQIPDNQTLQANDGEVGLSTSEEGTDPIRLWAGSADRENAPWRVTKSGKMFATGAEIQSSTGFPKVHINPGGNYFRASQDTNTYIEVGSTSEVSSPILRFINAIVSAAIYVDNIQMVLLSDNDIFLNPAGYVKLPSWIYLLNNATGRTLQQELNDLQSQIDSLNARVTALENA